MLVTRQKTSFFISLPSSNLNHLSYSISIEVADQWEHTDKLQSSRRLIGELNCRRLDWIPFFQIFLHLTLEYRLINTDLKLDWLRCFHSCEAVNFFVTLKNPTKTLFFLQISSHQSHFQFNIEFYVVILNSFICMQTVNVVDLFFYYKGDVWWLLILINSRVKIKFHNSNELSVFLME